MEGSTQHPPDLGSVVVGVDGSSTALTAAFWAAAEASRRNSTLHLFYAADTADRIFYLSAEIIERVHAEGRDLLEVTAAAVSERFPALHVTTEYSRRDPVFGLHRVGAKYGTTVVGHRGLGGFEALRLGSVGLRVVAAATTLSSWCAAARTLPRAGWCWPRSGTSTTSNAHDAPPAKQSCARRRCGC